MLQPDRTGIESLREPSCTGKGYWRMAPYGRSNVLEGHQWIAQHGRSNVLLDQHRLHIAQHRLHGHGVGPTLVLLIGERPVDQSTSGFARAGVTLASDGAGCVTAASSSTLWVSASWTCRPERARNIVAPTAHKSVRPSSSSDRPQACSGGMNAGVPIVEPDGVACERCGLPSRAIPKSSSLTWPLEVRKMLLGLISRWTIPLACAATS